MNEELKEKLEFKYSKMPEIAYYVMLFVVVSVIIASTIATYLIRKATGSEIVLIPDNIFKFIIDVLGIFVLPISVKIGGEVFVKSIQIWKSNQSQKIIIDDEENPSIIQKEIEKVYKKK